MGARNLIDLQISTIRGVAENVDMACIGKAPVEVIKAGDTILACLEFDTEGTIATLKDVSDHAVISRTGYVQVDTAPSSTAWKGLLFWIRENGGQQVFDRLCLKVKLVTGGAAAADLACTGLEVGDTLLGVFHFSTAAAISTVDDITHLCEIHDAAVLHCSIDTTNDQFLVFFHDANGVGAIDSPNLRFAILAGAAADTDIACADKAANAIAVADEILFCGHFTTAAAVQSMEDKTSEAHATHTAGSIQLETTDTTNDALFVIWNDVA